TFNQNYNSAFFSNYLYSYLGFNCRPDGIRHKKLFDDVEVRKAIATAIPYDIINQIAYSNFNKRISGPVPPLKAESNSSIPLVKHDLVEAARILDEAGWIDSDGDNVRDKLIDGERVPLEFGLNYMVTPNTWKTTALLIAESLKEIGVRCNPQPLSFAVLRQKNRDHDFDAMLSAWSSSSFPEDYTQIWGTESWTKHGSNYVGFGNAASDMLIDSIKQETNLVRRKELSNRLQEMIVENQPYAFLFSYSKRVVAHKRFHNVQFGPNPPHVNLSEWVQNPLGSSDSQQDN
ncbi:MAG: ABC transporter substrate-binding protein, partial [Flavobacteriales bacterium]